MKRTFNIFGEICDTDADCVSFEDTTPNQVASFLKKLDNEDEIEFVISSPGGSCSAGLAISNMIKTCGKKTSARVVGLAASMASVIACSCEELLIDSNAMIMVHLPWTYTIGNANDLRKEAEVLDQYKDALLAVYKTKFDLPVEQIEKMLVDETWITGQYADTVGLKCTVIPNEEPIRAAACSKMPKFVHQPENIKDFIKVTNTMPKEKTLEQPVVEQPVVEDKVEKPVVQEETVPLAEVEKRVSGMQSTMAKQMDSLRKEYDAKVNDLTVKLEEKDKELTSVSAKVISLTKDLEDAKSELQKTVSALEDKQHALDILNANVNKPSCEKAEQPKYRFTYKNNNQQK